MMIHLYPDNIRKFITDLPRSNAKVWPGSGAPELPCLRMAASADDGSSPAASRFSREGRKGVDWHSAVLKKTADE
jgi:hypothetical protein